LRSRLDGVRLRVVARRRLRTPPRWCFVAPAHLDPDRRAATRTADVASLVDQAESLRYEKTNAVRDVGEELDERRARRQSVRRRDKNPDGLRACGSPADWLGDLPPETCERRRRHPHRADRDLSSRETTLRRERRMWQDRGEIEEPHALAEFVVEAVRTNV